MHMCMISKGAKQEQQSDEEHVPSARNLRSEVGSRNKRTICRGSLYSPMIRFPVCYHNGSQAEKTRNETPWRPMFADGIVLCAVETNALEVVLEGQREAMEKRGIQVPRVNSIVNKEHSCL